jgi:hypothetical protein
VRVIHGIARYRPTRGAGLFPGRCRSRCDRWTSGASIPAGFEPKTVKDRIHLDLRVDYIDEVCGRIIELGAVRVGQGDLHEYDVVFRVTLDPDGSEFCLVSHAVREASGGDR